MIMAGGRGILRARSALIRNEPGARTKVRTWTSEWPTGWLASDVRFPGMTRASSSGVWGPGPSLAPRGERACGASACGAQGSAANPRDS